MLSVLTRFRMRQVNIVGSSPMSAPSRLIQTLQAAPDTHPSNLTLLSATQTCLRFNWKVLNTHTLLCITLLCPFTIIKTELNDGDFLSDLLCSCISVYFSYCCISAWMHMRLTVQVYRVSDSLYSAIAVSLRDAHPILVHS